MSTVSAHFKAPYSSKYHKILGDGDDGGKNENLPNIKIARVSRRTIRTDYVRVLTVFNIAAQIVDTTTASRDQPNERLPAQHQAKK